ncbi:Uncharacterized protein dnm_039660 [Desulfonema magnum]|uniref:Uncharacterized protein n=1 Tax=Desulfonema magnum TaxID=45655 RepID=A0A975GNM4_9BACT|nr:Uncharacterized protein dnm_039660 [Desulfonema magnum]
MYEFAILILSFALLQICRPYGAWMVFFADYSTNMPPLQGLDGVFCRLFYWKNHIHRHICNI